MEKKMTKKDYFTMLLNVKEVKANADLVKFVEHELELLEKKSGSKKQTETQKANVELMEEVKSVLATCEKAVTVSELMKVHEFILPNGEVASNQKLSAMLKKMADNKTVVRTVEKKKAYFSLA